MISRDISADMGEMVLIEGGRFHMGSDRYYPEEAPVRAVEVGSFLIDVHPVTNRQFAEFVHATKYVTVAEQAPDPADFPGALKHKLNPGALVFKPSPRPIPTDDWQQGRGAVAPAGSENQRHCGPPRPSGDLHRLRGRRRSCRPGGEGTAERGAMGICGSGGPRQQGFCLGRQLHA
jgi:hypothetical protein